MRVSTFSAIRSLRRPHVQFDELWRSPTPSRGTCAPRIRRSGKTPTWAVLDTDTELIITHLVGKRDAESANGFVADYSSRVRGVHQVTWDGFRPHVEATEAGIAHHVRELGELLALE